jgi:hypothetical protein
MLEATKVDTNGFGLRCLVEHVKMKDILERYPEGRMEGFDDPDRGYDQDEVGFVDADTGEEFYVYARYGRVRIGGRGQGISDVVERLACKLQAEVGLVKV